MPHDTNSIEGTSILSPTVLCNQRLLVPGDKQSYEKRGMLRREDTHERGLYPEVFEARETCHNRDDDRDVDGG